ncbi:MAG: hypothetical protein M1136_06085 [Chloroflexi bacterium]|nr:hypothetical protein [Chloroflexota bacterium]
MKKGSFLRGILTGLVAIAWLVGLRWLIKQGKVKAVGTFLGLPYDLRCPTWSVIKERMWNPADPHILTPHICGWGWSINLHALGRKLGVLS